MVNLKRLRVLDLTNCLAPGHSSQASVMYMDDPSTLLEGPQLSRQLPFAIAKQCEYLEAFGVAVCYAVLLRRQSSLGCEDLSLASCPMLRAAALVTAMLDEATGDRLWHCQDDHVRRILICCKRLQRLDLSGRYVMPCPTLVHFVGCVSGCKILSVTPFLEAGQSTVAWISVKHVERRSAQVVSHAHSLRRLNLSHIPAITDQAGRFPVCSATGSPQ